MYSERYNTVNKPVSRTSVLGVPVDVILFQDAVQWCLDVAVRREGPGKVVVTINPEMVMRAKEDLSFLHDVEQASLIIPDGIGIVRALRRRNYECERVTGADLIASLMPKTVEHRLRLALVGGAPGVAAQAAEVYREQFPGVNIVTADSGPPDAMTAQRVARKVPDIVLAAYGAGKQERFLTAYLSTMEASLGIGIGGTLDYAADIVPRAPVAMQRAGMEWMWRLFLQPWRIGRQRALPAFWLEERIHAHPKGCHL